MSKAETVIVTGSSSGFGYLTSLTLARGGHRVVATMRAKESRNAAAAERLHDIASTELLALRVVELDVTDDASVAAAVGDVLDTEGAIDVVVNNAGAHYEGLLETISAEQALAQLDTNLVGALRVNRAVLPHMRARGSGLLIHVSSGLGRLVRPGLGIYCASKFGLEAAAECYRYELAHLGVDSVVVEPGVFPTDFAARGSTGADVERAEGYGAWTRELGIPASDNDPQEVADAIAALIAAPAGERPLRTLVGLPAAAVLPPLNELTDRIAAGVLERSGLAEHAKLRTGDQTGEPV